MLLRIADNYMVSGIITVQEDSLGHTAGTILPDSYLPRGLP